MFWALLLISGVVSYLLLIKLPKRQALLSKLASIKGPPALPLVGNAFDFQVPKRDILPLLKGYLDSYGPRLKIFLGMQPYIIIANAADTEKILSSQTQIEKSADYDRMHDWLGLGLLTSRGEKWFHRRKQLTPAFHFKILEDFLRVFNEQCLVFKGVLEGKMREKKAFDIFPVITHCALDIICETAMGRKVFVQQKSDSEYVKAIYRLSDLVQYRQFRPWLHSDLMWKLSSSGKENDQCLKILHGFTDLVIRERKEERAEMLKESPKEKNSKQDDGVYMNCTYENCIQLFDSVLDTLILNFFSIAKKKLAFLDLLLDAQQTDATLTDKNVREETDTFMFEGHDTTSAAASWTTFLLSLHPEYQTKVHQEMDDIFGSDRTREVTMADLSKMKYLECCIKEGLRIFPSVPFIGRKLTKDQTLDDGVVLPQGVTIMCLIYFLHRDPKVFPNPEKFDPSRFAQEEGGTQGRHPFAYVPFSAGPRNCIGQKFAMMEEKVMISTIFRNFRVHAAERMEDVDVLCELITRPEAGLHVTLEKR
ncbi:Cytochrome P450 4c3 [Orchesella cincta]|uniref:Cytochrome P450 4c3 n=1 Tax=Orchesella cincta TaxID=48709 RepID=A0A1D2M7N3_ORCCI|nr:Cytochrome P450 4c3 [Orchesella cincta]